MHRQTIACRGCLETLSAVRSRARRESERRDDPGNARAFRAGGRAAIDKVMRTQPAVFLKLLVLSGSSRDGSQAYERRQSDD